MEKLEDAIHERIRSTTSPDFRRVAHSWAGYCIEKLTDPLLHEGLMLAEQLVRFQTKFEECLKGFDDGPNT